MNYDQLLALMPAELRASIEAETVYASWLSRGQTLEQLWSDDVVLETICNRLAGAERKVLVAVVSRIGSEPFDDARLERTLGTSMSGAETAAGLAGLRRKGLILAFRKTWGELLYVLPSDALPRWQRLLFANAAEWESAEQVAGPSVEPIACTVRPIREPAVTVLDLLVFSAKQELKLTKGGVLMKRTVQRLGELLGWQQDDFCGVPLKHAHADTYPLPVALLLDWLLRLGLLAEQQGELKVQKSALHTFLSGTRSLQNDQLYALWRGAAWPQASWLQHAALCLEAAPEGAWLEPAAIVSKLQRAGLLPAAGEEHRFEYVRRLEEQWLRPLHALGWLEKGLAGGEATRTVYAWHCRPFTSVSSVMSGTSVSQGTAVLAMSADTAMEAEAPFVLQPDFDVLIPPDAPLKLQWELLCFTEALKRDTLSVCKLTKSSVKHALEQGRCADDILCFLEKHCAYGVPDNVRIAVEQWARPFGLTKLSRAVLLRCADVDTASAIGRLPHAAKYLAEPLGELHYRVEEEHVPALAAALEKAGFMPEVALDGAGEHASLRYPQLVSADEEEETVRTAAAADGNCQGLLYARSSLAYYQLETRLPESHDLYPELRDIPASWLKDYRSYHASTRRDIVERAIALRTLLQIRRNGADCRIVPRKVQDTRGTWCVTALERGGTSEEANTGELRLLADEWEEMKLILPGINDKY
ncbi:helicase-associated domain-containing protein [Paenibacillus sp. YYML68]|uniref:helicase-associated domain-containing protein n=1 Tax=Paenibacillus sp. YYML68 TaxID=2909250 RepID=UPI0024924389|nr:helicase-associated domain-containing protein [Paenibacillus sp. YYML68]